MGLGLPAVSHSLGAGAVQDGSPLTRCTGLLLACSNTGWSVVAMQNPIVRVAATAPRKLEVKLVGLKLFEAHGR